MQAAPFILKAGSLVAGGIAESRAAKAEQKNAEINNFIARTRAIQTDTTQRQNLESEIGSARATFAANEQRMSVSTLGLLNEIRETRNRERRISVGNEMTRAYDFSRQARNAGDRSRSAITRGFIKAGPSLFDLAQVI